MIERREVEKHEVVYVSHSVFKASDVSRENNI